MTQEANNSAFPSCAEEVAVYVEHLVRQTNEDLKKFRLEQAAFHAHISTIMDENENLNKKLEKSHKAGNSEDAVHLREQLGYANEAVNKATAQIELFKKDRQCLQKMLDYANQTIKNMETELQSYRTFSKSNNQLIYDKSIKGLQQKLAAQNLKLETQEHSIQELQEQKTRYKQHIEELQMDLKQRQHDTKNWEENESKISSLHKQLKEKSKSLQQAQVMLEKSTKREEIAMQKVQEAIVISESVAKEKEDAEKLAQTYKEEAAHLATNIGSIMDEASKRVDNEVDQLRAKLSKRDKTILGLRDKINKLLTEHKGQVDTLEGRYNRITEKYEQTLKQNEKLESHVETCSKRLLEIQHRNTRDEEHALKIKKDRDTQLEHYVQSSRELKTHYTTVLNDLTQRFQTELEKMHKENCELRAENNLLRNGPAGNGIAKFL